MALDIKHIINKRTIDIHGDGTIVDLTTRSANFIDKIRAKSFAQVEYGMEMRPDLFSLKYGDINDFTSILKFNSISNPFSFDSTDIIFLPGEDANLLQLDPPSNLDEDEQEDVRLSYVDVSKAATPDPKISTLNGKYDSVINTPSMIHKKANLPPNFNDFNEDEVEVKNNKIRFAPGVSRNSGECSTDPISKSDLISRVIKNKIGGQ